ncbi:MAG TPA: formylmethanofuran dehydrogenase subunit E family protein [Candidatus Acidoferrum sp.]|nr:formylmethanofuran dehydrogenase subunit E family protein [Candidatus Acidoferrum sp.]
MKTNKLGAAGLVVAGLVLAAAAHDLGPGAKPVRSEPGSNTWNEGQPPADWQAEIRRYHGHVGPWNVLGWRIGQAALRQFKSRWGAHELEIVCYVPPETPFTCLVDGLAVGTGNSQGRMDLRMAEVLTWEESFVAARRKDGHGGVTEFRPQADYLRSIMGQPVEKLAPLCEECSRMPEEKLFAVRHVSSIAPAFRKDMPPEPGATTP